MTQEITVLEPIIKPKTHKKDFDSWNNVKKKSQKKNVSPPFKEREVWWGKCGINIGDEQDGKGKLFLRPFLVIRKLNKNVFIGVPLSTKVKENHSFYHTFEFKGKLQSAIIAQIKLLDAKRLIDRMGTISDSELRTIKDKIRNLIL